MCGEHTEKVAAFQRVPGSSLRVRGTREAPVNVRVVGGIIPACAGNTPWVEDIA